MKDQELERILSEEEALEPSAGFAEAVMNEVWRAATEPPPLPFPWARFAVGVAACGIVSAAGVSVAGRAEPFVVEAMSFLAPLATVGPELGYAAAGLLFGLFVSRLPRLFAGP